MSAVPLSLDVGVNTNSPRKPQTICAGVVRAFSNKWMLKQSRDAPTCCWILPCVCAVKAWQGLVAALDPAFGPPRPQDQGNIVPATAAVGSVRSPQPRSYWMPTEADKGTIALRRWLDKSLRQKVAAGVGSCHGLVISHRHTWNHARTHLELDCSFLQLRNGGIVQPQAHFLIKQDSST